jgi:hypothetical protein
MVSPQIITLRKHIRQGPLFTRLLLSILHSLFFVMASASLLLDLSHVDVRNSFFAIEDLGDLFQGRTFGFNVAASFQSASSRTSRGKGSERTQSTRK